MATVLEHLLCHLVPALLEVHDGVADLDVDGLDHSLDVERTDESLANCGETVDKLVPALVKLCVVGQATLHHVEAVGGAGLDCRQPLAGWAGGHLGQGLCALVLGLDLEDP